MMKNISKNTESTRKFLKTTGLTAAAAAFFTLLPAHLFSKRGWTKSNITVKPHPLAIKRNKRG